MIISLTVITLAFTWLLYETDWFTVRLIVEAKVKPRYARYEAYNERGSYHAIHIGGNAPPNYSPNGQPSYSIQLSSGVDNVLCGWEWLDEHCADLVDYKPKVFMAIGNVRYTMTIKQPSIIKDIMRVNKLTKKEVQALA